MRPLTDAQISAATAMAEVINTLPYTPLTRVQAAARLTGTFLFRAFAMALSPQSPGTVLNFAVAGNNGPMLVGLLEVTLTRLGVTVDTARIDLASLKQGADEIGFLDTQRLLEPRLAALRQQFELSHEQAAQACAVATALLIRKEIPAGETQMAVTRAIYAFIEGSKTVPAPLPG